MLAFHFAMFLLPAAIIGCAIVLALLTKDREA
jgi:hypothetical protein